MLLFFFQIAQEIDGESSFSSFASSANCANVLERSRILPSFFGTVLPESSVFHRNINGFNDGGSADTLHKVKHAIIWVTLLCAWARRKVAVPFNSVQNTSYSGEGRDWMRKTRVHLRVEFEKHSSGCHT